MAAVKGWRIFASYSLPFFSRSSRYTGMKLSTKPAKNLTSVLLKNRGHIEVKGEDAVKFLQGLLTNDVTLFHCDDQMSALYAMMLNTRGRVLYDLILYKLKGSSVSPAFLLECDLNAVANVIKTFKPYRLRSKVTFTDVSERFKSYAVLEETGLTGLQRTESDSNAPIVVKDPRLSLLGSRLVLPENEHPTEHYSNIVEVNDQNAYDHHRVRLGVAEGMKDFDPGVPLPLEYNIPELHGVSFQKGCYIGQELTARTYHTGIIRKRVLPIKLAIDQGQCMVEKGAIITTTAGKQAGKLISVYDMLGLALMRLDVVKSADNLSVPLADGKDVAINVDWPTWWNSN